VNEFAFTTFFSFCLLIPFVLRFESGETMIITWEHIVASGQSISFLWNVGMAGICFYIYNELQNVILGSLGPVPTAVGNTLKRIAIFVALYFFTVGETFPISKMIGCTIAMIGCFGFAICDSKKI
jgi:drug/metabolite transporter (DMT)-like permease